jgi:hypothetical protein
MHWNAANEKKEAETIKIVKYHKMFSLSHCSGTQKWSERESEGGEIR